MVHDHETTGRTRLPSRSHHAEARQRGIIIGHSPGVPVSYFRHSYIMQHRSLLFTLLFISITILFQNCGSSGRLLEPESDWVFLGQRKVNHIREKDVFKIESKEQFAAIRLYVYRRDVSIKSVDIMLINGDILRPSIEDHIPAGGRSKTIELSTEGRQVEKVVIRYRSDGKWFSDKALMQLGGLRPGRLSTSGR